MQLIDQGILFQAEPGTRRAVLTFGTLLSLSDGGVLATLRSGPNKDSDDEAVELYRSDDGGHNWRALQLPASDHAIGGVRGSLKVCYLTEIAPGHVLAAAMLIDRENYPGKPLFNPDTEGCLPMFIVLAESRDGGESWSPWRLIPTPEELGPASLTSPVLSLPDGRLVLSIETNKQYEDATRWYQRVVLLHSTDGGRNWGAPVTAGQDPSGRIFNWDQRLGLAPDGRIGAFLWTYDSEERRYLNIHRRISGDGGLTWSVAEDLGFPDQAGHPAILPDGRVVLPWVDRFQSHAIHVRVASAIDAPFDPASDLTLYSLLGTGSRDGGETTGAMLADMGLWTFGLPFAELLPDGEVLVVYYAGSEAAMDIRFARLKLT